MSAGKHVQRGGAKRVCTTHARANYMVGSLPAKPLGFWRLLAWSHAYANPLSVRRPEGQRAKFLGFDCPTAEAVGYRAR